MDGARSIVNLQDPAGKTVGRRLPPHDPLLAAMTLQETANQLMKESGHRMARKGVYRFRSHEGDDAWARKTISPNRRA